MQVELSLFPTRMMLGVIALPLIITVEVPLQHSITLSVIAVTTTMLTLDCIILIVDIMTLILAGLLMRMGN